MSWDKPDKAPAIQLDEETAPPTRKAGHRRTKTACQVNRRQLGVCGCCGSADVVYQGVVCCDGCGYEREYLDAELPFCGYVLWSRRRGAAGEEQHCPNGCHDDWLKKEPRDLLFVGVAKCLACGAIGRGRPCPSCGKAHWFWHESRTKTSFCQHCGYRIEQQANRLV